jgi:hypothetical protein
MIATVTSIIPAADPSGASIEFCDELFSVDRLPFTIGRDADLTLEAENLHLHRRFLTIERQRGIWLLGNVGSRLTATVSDGASRLEAFLAPGAVLPLVFADTIVRFTAGPTTYEFSIHVPESPFAAAELDGPEDGDPTVGRVSMTPDQLLLIVALAEPVLRGNGRAASSMPSNQDVARRLGWRLTRVNRKLDNVCQKLAAQGVRGMHGAPGRLASNRRARLVEYALAVRMISRDDLALLDRHDEATDA